MRRDWPGLAGCANPATGAASVTATSSPAHHSAPSRSPTRPPREEKKITGRRRLAERAGPPRLPGAPRLPGLRLWKGCGGALRPAPRGDSMTRRDRLMKGRPQRQPEAGADPRAGYILTRPTLVLMLERGEQPCMSNSKNGVGNNTLSSSVADSQALKENAKSPSPSALSSPPATESPKPPRPRRRRPPAVLPSDRPYQCKDCGKRFVYRSKLATHQWTHCAERPYKCPDCPKSFSYPSKLAAHRRTHTGERPFPCSLCPKRFGHRSKLAAHQWIHTPERPYKCADCPKSFCYPSKLAAHRRTHTGQRPYPCSRCGKSFCYPSKLAAHQQIHAATAAGRSYPCMRCSKSFRQLRNLTLHQRVHEDGEAGGDLAQTKSHSSGDRP
ncbi:zinc finger protein 575 isoform 1-T1 [Liasis olivaceus]